MEARVREFPHGACVHFAVGFLESPAYASIFVLVGAGALAVEVGILRCGGGTAARCAYDGINTICRNDELIVEGYESVLEFLHSVVVGLEGECAFGNALGDVNCVLIGLDRASVKVSGLGSLNGRVDPRFSVGNGLVELALVGEYGHECFVGSFQGVDGALGGLFGCDFGFGLCYRVFEVRYSCGIHVCIYAVGVVFGLVDAELREVPVCAAIILTVGVIGNFLDVACYGQTDVLVGLRHFDAGHTCTLEDGLCGALGRYVNFVAFAVERSEVPG